MKSQTKKGNYMGSETGSNHYALMLDNHHNKLYSGPKKEEESEIINQLERFKKTNKKFGIDNEVLTRKGKSKMGLDMKYKETSLPLKKGDRKKRDLSLLKSKQRIRGNPSLKPGTKRNRPIVHVRSKSFNDLNNETPKLSMNRPQRCLLYTSPSPRD